MVVSGVNVYRHIFNGIFICIIHGVSGICFFLVGTCWDWVSRTKCHRPTSRGADDGAGALSEWTASQTNSLLIASGLKYWSTFEACIKVHNMPSQTCAWTSQWCRHCLRFAAKCVQAFAQENLWAAGFKGKMGRGSFVTHDWTLWLDVSSRACEDCTL